MLVFFQHSWMFSFQTILLCFDASEFFSQLFFLNPHGQTLTFLLLFITQWPKSAYMNVHCFPEQSSLWQSVTTLISWISIKFQGETLQGNSLPVLFEQQIMGSPDFEKWLKILSFPRRIQDPPHTHNEFICNTCSSLSVFKWCKLLSNMNAHHFLQCTNT